MELFLYEKVFVVFTILFAASCSELNFPSPYNAITAFPINSLSGVLHTEISVLEFSAFNCTHFEVFACPPVIEIGSEKGMSFSFASFFNLSRELVKLFNISERINGINTVIVYYKNP